MYKKYRIHVEKTFVADKQAVLNMDEVTPSREESLKRLNAIAAKIRDMKGIVVREYAVEDVRFICNLYSSLENKIPSTELENFRKEVAKIMMETSILKYLTNIIVAYPADVYCHIATYEDSYLLFLALSLLLFYTSDSEAFAEAVGDTAITKFCKKLLEICAADHLKENLSEILEKIIHTTLSLLQVLSMTEANVKHLRSLELTKAVQPYLKSPDEEISLISMTVIAKIATEEECSIIATHDHLVAKLLYFLQKGMETESRNYEGWSTKRCSRAVVNLAKNDTNKKLLWNLNALHTLADLAQTGDEEEQFESVRAIWALSFDEDIRRDIVNDKEHRVINLLQSLEQSTTNEHIKDACTKCLWTLGQNVKTSQETTAQEPVNTVPQKAVSNASKGHIMISYQSLNRKILLDIKHILEEKNYEVWMDVDRMGGSTLQAMAEGVENAAVVLLCYSRKYKESENCRLEAEYIHEQRKPFIPLKMEQGYKPDGWLGLLIGSRYFVDFSGKYKFEDKLVDLFRELNRILESEETNNQLTSNVVESSVKSIPWNEKRDEQIHSHSELHDNTKEPKMRKLEQIKRIRKWNKDEVFNWLNENNLQNQGLDDLTGDEISFLSRVMMEAPDKMYDILTKDMKVNSLLLKSRLVWALDELINNLK